MHFSGMELGLILPYVPASVQTMVGTSTVDAKGVLAIRAMTHTSISINYRWTLAINPWTKFNI